MILQHVYVLAFLQFLFLIQASSAGYTPLQTYHNADKDTTIAIKRALDSAKGTTYTLNETKLTKSWADATLFSAGISSSTNASVASEDATLDLEGGLAVVCAACYINGSVSGFLTVENDFNITQAIDNVVDEVANVTESAIDQLETFVDDLIGNVTDIDSISDFDFPAWPTLDLDLDLDDADGFPDVHAQFEFNDLELYVELDIQLSAGATYTLNLFTSQSVAGFSIPGLEAGALFKVSLVLIAQAEIDISSGFHIKLDDAFALELELFNKNVSQISMPGGRMEFLPVVIEGHGSLQALLLLEASVGFEIASPNSILADIASFSAGIGAEVFAYVGDFLVQADASTSDDADCAVEVVAEYTLAVGAAAGATVAVAEYEWGPAPSTTVPIFYTTLASICAGSKTSSPTTTPVSTLEERDNDLEKTTTTVSTTSTYTMVSCSSKGLVNCPVRLQSTTSVERALTTVLTVGPNMEATFPVDTFTTLEGAISFGNNVRTFGALSGTPVSYVPPQPTSSETGSAESVGSADDGGNSNKTQLIIGLSVGLGVPAVIAIAIGLWWLSYKHKGSRIKQDGVTAASPGQEQGAKQPMTTVSAT
ncbi:hypothetical protein AN3520.2 [Aspergillus nidulans FGSC A4]|uniref:Mid2 domain-containing protein n=1 Tax=Emericella nidulans (strain FGSC A4 / ATCC 38163 / CBS 112.46 / NRRL 194 / M139) TaxID=227321 RepID=Q5B7G0_EMENI|nr:hypothetical protein [Aspergillus nidulans FGSC A4]EAA59081.1 hypothetical protein AN3520.2 [Aspergillus nidulans FGSC A4]CBF75982.1 TPA: conserved hypothetical protein [Aspergillus nidulans FGSC A4]|eukprot:XP_661124.1 hypothetical protein AN3520.2 [Aspergillus nidulans FGSC A4]